MQAGKCIRRQLKVNGVHTSYLEAGDVRNRPVILIHDGAFGSDAENCWGQIIPALAGEFWILAPDLLGHGHTAKVFSFDADARTQRTAHIADFLDVLGITDPILIGNSFGGGVVLRSAASGSLPMACGVAICGAGGAFQVGEIFNRLLDYQPTLEWSRGVCELLVAEPDDEMISDRLAKSVIPGHYQTLAAPRLRLPGREAPARRGGDVGDYLDAVGHSGVPLLLLAGGDDVLLEKGWQDHFATHGGNVRTEVIDGGRHQPQVDQPEIVAERIVQFINGL